MKKWMIAIGLVLVFSTTASACWDSLFSSIIAVETCRPKIIRHTVVSPAKTALIQAPGVECVDGVCSFPRVRRTKVLVTTPPVVVKQEKVVVAAIPEQTQHTCCIPATSTARIYQKTKVRIRQRWAPVRSLICRFCL